MAPVDKMKILKRQDHSIDILQHQPQMNPHLQPDRKGSKNIRANSIEVGSGNDSGKLPKLIEDIKLRKLESEYHHSDRGNEIIRTNNGSCKTIQTNRNPNT